MAEALDAAAGDVEALGELGGGEVASGDANGGGTRLGGEARVGVEPKQGERRARGVGETGEVGLDALEVEELWEALDGEAGQRRTEAGQQVGSDDAHREEVGGAARFVAEVELDGVALFLAEHIEEGALEVALMSDRLEARSVERRGEAEPPSHAHGGSVRESARLLARTEHDRVRVGVGDTKREESAASSCLMKNARRRALSDGGGRHHLRGDEPHHDVMSERSVVGHGLSSTEASASCGSR